MERIQSLRINHDVLEPGIYVSRVDGDITTYDLRTRKPTTWTRSRCTRSST